MSRLHKNKKALGRGFEALLSRTSQHEDGTEEGIQSIAIDKISSNPEQPRKSFDGEKLRELSDSIRSKGILQPILLRSIDTHAYQIIAGERRYRAARQAGLLHIPAIIRTEGDSEALELALLENVQREDLSPIEEAQAYQALISQYQYTQEDIALKMGKSRSSIANLLRLLTLSEDIRQDISSGVLSAGHGRALLSVKNEQDRQQLNQKIAQEQLSVRESEALAKAMQNTSRSADKHGIKGKQDKTDQAPEKQTDQTLAKAKLIEQQHNLIQEALCDMLGTKVIIRSQNGAGKLEIFFHNTDDFNRIHDILFRTP